MSIVANSQAEQELTALAARFQQWRQTRATPHERIPEALWAQAASLSQVLPISRVAKTLRLSPSDLKKHCATCWEAVPAEPAPPEPSFVEITDPPPWLARPGGAEVEVERPDGARLRIHYRDSQLPVATWVRAFLEQP